MIASMLSLIHREQQASASDWIGMSGEAETMLTLLTVYNWIKGVIRTMASVIVTVTGLLLLGRDLPGPQAGLTLSFAVVASQGLCSCNPTGHY